MTSYLRNTTSNDNATEVNHGVGGEKQICRGEQFYKKNYAYVDLGVLYSMCLSYYSFINEIKDIFAFRFDKTTISLCVVSSWQKRGQLIW